MGGQDAQRPRPELGVPREGTHHAFPRMHEVWKEERSVSSEKKGDNDHVESGSQTLAGQRPAPFPILSITELQPCQNKC